MYDPTQPPVGLNALMSHEYNELRQQEGVSELDISNGNVAEVALNEVPPLKIEGGRNALLATVQAGPDKRFKVWGVYNADRDTVDSSVIYVTDEDYDLAGTGSNTQPFTAIQAGKPETIFGRSEIATPNRSSLPMTVSRRHFSVALTADGKLQLADKGSSWGTMLLVRHGQEQSGAHDTAAQEAGVYDHLFMPDQSKNTVESSMVTVTAENEKNPRLELLFAPIVTRDEYLKNAPVATYEHLFEKDDEEYVLKSAAFSEQALERRKEEAKHPVVTSEDKANALVALQKARASDSSINAIISEYEGKLGKDQQQYDIVDLIRKDGDLRYRLGRYLLYDKMSARMALMPDRISNNDQKGPSHRGYEHIPNLRSREYASMLALSMLDGTYKGYSNGDEIKYDSSGRPTVGQHRGAAHILLGR